MSVGATRRAVPRRFRDALLVAGFELRDSLRSRKAIVLLVLYVAGAAAASGIFLRVLLEIEETLAETLGVASSSQPGAATHALFASDQFLSILSGLVGDHDLARSLVQMPPMALFYGWLALTFGPLLAVLVSCDAIASEIGQGSARFALVRADRAAWTLGKGLGQAGLVAVGLAAGGIATWIVGALFLDGFDAAASAWWIARLGGRAWILTLAYLGLALGVSQALRSANAARAGAFFALVVLAMIGEGLEWLEDSAPTVAGTLLQALPRAHVLDLWRPEVTDRLPAMAMLVAIAGCFFALGHVVFRRRDA